MHFIHIVFLSFSLILWQREDGAGAIDDDAMMTSSSFETCFSTLQFPLLVKQFSAAGTTLAAPNDTQGAIVDTPWIVSDGSNVNSLSAIDHGNFFLILFFNLTVRVVVSLFAFSSSVLMSCQLILFIILLMS